MIGELNFLRAHLLITILNTDLFSSCKMPDKTESWVEKPLVGDGKRCMEENAEVYVEKKAKISIEKDANIPVEEATQVLVGDTPHKTHTEQATTYSNPRRSKA